MVTYAKIVPKIVNTRDIAGNTEEEVRRRERVGVGRQNDFFWGGGGGWEECEERGIEIKKRVGRGGGGFRPAGVKARG